MLDGFRSTTNQPPAQLGQKFYEFAHLQNFANNMLSRYPGTVRMVNDDILFPCMMDVTVSCIKMGKNALSRHSLKT